MNPTLVAKQPMFYRHRALTAGQTFEATPIDAQYFVRRGQAAVLPAAPVSDVIKAEPVAPVVAPAASEVLTLSSAPEVKAEAPVEVATEPEVATFSTAPAESTPTEAAPKSFDPAAADTSDDAGVDAVDATAITDPVAPPKRTYRRRTPAAAE